MSGANHHLDLPSWHHFCCAAMIVTLWAHQHHKQCEFCSTMRKKWRRGGTAASPGATRSASSPPGSDRWRPHPFPTADDADVQLKASASPCKSSYLQSKTVNKNVPFIRLNHYNLESIYFYILSSSGRSCFFTCQVLWWCIAGPPLFRNELRECNVIAWRLDMWNIMIL